MSFIKTEDSNKWINGLVAIVSVICGVLLTRFIEQMSTWFDLETKISNLALVSQGAGFLFGLSVFVYIVRAKKTSEYLQEVYAELVKVVWPSRDATIKITIGLAVALVIVSSIFVSVDYVFKYILSFIY